MKSEYDLSTMKGAVRGKYYKAYQAGHSVRISQADGGIIVKNYRLQDGAVVLAPDVRKYFPDADAVNAALRCLIPLVSKQKAAKSRT